MTAAEIVAGLPRPLRNGAVLQRIIEADEAYRREGRTGPLVIEWHYAQGVARKVKVISGSELLLDP